MTARASILCLALGAAIGCAGPSVDPTAPTLELVDITQRLDAASVNTHTYGSFVFTAGGPGAVIRSGPANFPGKPNGGPGTCQDGLWINSNGKPTAGSLTHPHPHCVSADAVITIVLEPISSRTRPPGEKCAVGTVCDFLEFSSTKANDIDVNFVPAIKGNPTPAGTVGTGTVVAYAIDAATLGTTNHRVGTITIELSQYTVEDVNLFGSCALDDANLYQCLPLVITAQYEPLAVGGLGVATTVTGFIWWALAKMPYNY